jgi:hypothetical protein
MRKLFLLLALITAGAQGVWAGSEHWGNTRAEVKELTVGNVVYELCYTYDVTYYLSSYDFDTGVYTTNVWVKSNEQYYASAVRVNLSSGGPIVIEDNITDAGVTYPVKYVGLHTEEQSVDREVDYEWYEFFPTYIVHNDKVIVKQYKRIQSPTTINSTSIQSLTVKGNIEFKGDFTASSCHTAVFQGNVTFSNSMGLSSATQITFNGGATISSNGTLWVGSMSELRFNKLVHEGKIYCPSLTDIYFTNNSSSYLPVYSGAFSNYFAGRQGSQITCHLPEGTTESRIQQLKATAVFCDFKDIVAGESKVNYTIATDGNARIDFVELKGNASYVSATEISQIAFTSSGSKSGTVKAGGNYAVEIRDVDFDTKNVQLLRNGHVVTLEPYEDQGQPIRYYEDLDLQQDVRYEVSVSDKVCTVSFIQGENYTGRILYQKSYNGTTSTGVVTGASPTVACAQGSRLKLTIPYDPTSYTPNNLYLNGSEVTMTKANGEATATITVPTSATARIDLTWQAPQQTFTHHQPEIMIMRSGEGDILFKGLCAPEEQAQEAYEQQFGYPAENGVVVSAVANCTNTVTTVTVPDYDYLGRGASYEFDETEWGFRAEITPVAGQTLKTLLVGYIDEEEGRETIIWEDLLYGENYGMYVHPEYNYVTYNESTNTYTFNWGMDEMNVWIGDYVVNIGLGPEETAVETGATLNFVRQGGRTEVLFEKEDVDGTLTDQVIGEGSMSFNLKYFTQAELDDAGMNYYQLLWFNPVEGETIHVFCDGTDITSQLIYNSETGNARLELERKNHTYTILIEDAPNANPTWTIHNATEADVIVERTLKDGTTETTTYAGNLNDLVIDDTQVSKVTLKVYAENANESKPVRVLKNGQDVSYQFSTKQNDGDSFRLCYEVPVSELTNCSWDISYNTDRPQTFVVKGGTCNLLMEFYYENLEHEPVLDISPNDGPATVYLPPFNSEWNRYVTMTVYADEYEGLTIKRNGIDVTNYFTKTMQSNGKKYYELDIAEGDLEGNSTVGLLSFDIREAAVWEIVYKSVEEQMKTLRVSNLDQMEIVYERNYTDGTTASEYFKNAETGEIAKYVERIFDDSDRENTSSVYLKVPFKGANYQYYPVRVLCNGEDVTYQFSNFDPDGYLIYETNVEVDQTWDISRDVSHRQTFIRKGGTTWNVEVEFDFPVDGDERYFYPDQIGTPLYVDFPTYNSIYAPNAYIYIDVEEGSTFTVLRNGVDVTGKFVATNGAGSGFTRYMLSEADNGGSDTQAALGFQFRDPAVWEITIGDGNSDAVEYMFIGDYDKVYASADYNNDVDYEGFEFTQQNVEGYYAGKVVENGTALGKQGAVEFWLPAGKTFRAFYDGTDMTNQFTDYYNNGHWLFVSEDDWMHQPGHHWTIIAESDLMKYDTNRDGSITIADVTKLVNKVLNK